MCDNQTDIKQLEILEQKLGYCFQNKKRLLEALTHRSHKSANNNERLEFLGDAVLDLVIADFLFEKFPQLQEGSLSKMRAAIVNEKSFSQLAQHLGIGDFLLLSNAEENNNGRKKPSILSDTFEAIFGNLSRIQHCRCQKNHLYIARKHLPRFQSIQSQYRPQNNTPRAHTSALW